MHNEDGLDFRVTVRLEKHIHRAIKTAASLQGVSIQDWVAAAMEEHLKRVGLDGLLRLMPPKKVIETAERMQDITQNEKAT